MWCEDIENDDGVVTINNARHVSNRYTKSC